MSPRAAGPTIAIAVASLAVSCAAIVGVEDTENRGDVSGGGGAVTSSVASSVGASSSSSDATSTSTGPGPGGQGGAGQGGGGGDAVTSGGGDAPTSTTSGRGGGGGSGGEGPSSTGSGGADLLELGEPCEGDDECASDHCKTICLPVTTGRGWTRLESPPAPPGIAAGVSLVHDGTRWVAMGRTPAGVCGMFYWDGASAWTQGTVTFTCSSSHRIVYAENMDEVFVVGPSTADMPSGTAAVHADGWDDVGATPDPAFGGPREAFAAAGSANAGLFVHGGRVDDETIDSAYHLTMGDSSWDLLVGPFPQREGHAVVYNPPSGELVFWSGGGDPQETDEGPTDRTCIVDPFDDGSLACNDGGPRGRYGPAMTFRQTGIGQGEIVMFGGFDPDAQPQGFTDTWRWNREDFGTATVGWTLATLPAAAQADADLWPPPHASIAATSAMTLLIGVRDVENGSPAEIWEWIEVGQKCSPGDADELCGSGRCVARPFTGSGICCTSLCLGNGGQTCFDAAAPGICHTPL